MWNAPVNSFGSPGHEAERDLQDAGSHCPHRQGVEVFVDLASRVAPNYATAAVCGAYIIRAAHVQIGSVALRKEEAYTP